MRVLSLNNTVIEMNMKGAENGNSSEAWK
jgi:hypothetical protein